MKICLETKEDKKKKFKFFSLKFFLFCLLVLFLSVLLGTYPCEKEQEVDLDDEVEKEYLNHRTVFNVHESEEEEEERKKEAFSKIEEHVEDLPKKDVEVLEGYAKEVNDYIDNVLFLINFIDATFRLSASDFENMNDFLLIADETADVCIEYLGDKDIVPKDVLLKIEDSEKIAQSYCNSVKKQSTLIRDYWDEDDGENMVFLLKELREQYEDVEVKAYVLKRICKELEGMVF